MKPAYYNEIDQFAAQMLRNLIVAGHIAPGDVDERSIEDVHPSDLKPYTQCHFFAGIGVWSHALRRAGWPDDRPVWTGSCPCQPFSSAGQGAGFDDQRHLWPHFHWLIQECSPPVVFGEQVASRDANPWIDLVQDDLEGLGYRVGAVPFPSAGVGAPHIRDRLYWMANTSDQRQHGRRASAKGHGRYASRVELERLCDAGGLANATGTGSQGCQPAGQRAYPQREATERGGTSCRLANAILQQRSQGQSEVSDGHDSRGWQQGAAEASGLCIDSRRPGPTNGLWSAADWLLCRDGKWRPVEPGSFPLAHGAPARVGRLRTYGNAINAEAARVFIEAAMSCMT